MYSVQEYTEFRKKYIFTMPELQVDNDNMYFCGDLVEDSEKKYAEGETWINVGYGFKNSISRVLSNLYPMEFEFRGKKVKSIEGVLQGIKYKDIETQDLVLNYAGLDAYHTRACNEIDFWGESGILYWQGEEIVRESEDYQLFIDELYVSAISNPLYRRALLSTKNKYLLHHIGRNNSQETVLTRYELEERLNTLRDFVKLHYKI
ncbi:MAG: hypothetical protein IJW59_03545 [Clostridia bacterium]|nr:hypothetical protein [Clostridia bacterium]